MDQSNTSRSRFMVVMGIAASFYVVGCNSSSNNGNTNCNTVGNACAAGSICLNNACIPLCSADNDCAHNEICSSATSICEVCPNCRQVPELATINGTGTTDTTPGHAAKHIADSIMLTGTHFSGSEVTIHGGNYDHVALVTRGDVTDTSLEAILPRDLTAGTYTLTIANQAGSDSTQATVLQGERGAAGIYIAGDGIDVNGDTLSVVFGTEANTVAEGNHLHAQYAEISTVNGSITTTQANLTSTITALQNAMDGVTRPCGGTSGSLVKTFNGTTGEWSACSPTTWSCASQPSHPGCTQNATEGSSYNSCFAILRDGYQGVSGVLWIDTDGTGSASPFQVYCDMATQGGGWTLMLNLDTNDGVVRDYDNAFWTDSNPSNSVPSDGSLTAAFTSDFKSKAFASLSFTSIMLKAHNEGIYMGHAAYEISTGPNTTLSSLFNGPLDQAITSTSPITGGSVGSGGRAWNVGDAFIDNKLPIIINSSYVKHGVLSTNYPYDSRNRTRIGTNWENVVGGTGEDTTFVANYYANHNTYKSSHNVGGWGGRHYSPGATEAGDIWGRLFEGAAVCAYCVQYGGCAFGSDATNACPNGVNCTNYAFDNGSSNCGSTQIVSPNVDLAVFVR